MIRCVRMWTGNDGDSHFEEGVIDLVEGESGGSFAWHQDPVPRFVITLSGVLEFETRGGDTFTIRPGDILLAEDNTGTGHRWKLIGNEPWRRAYVVFQTGVALPFKATASHP